jgi:hypothetical protein
MSRQHLIVAGLVAAALSACKFGKSDDSADRPLPAPEPPAPDAGPALEPAAPAEAPRRTTPREKPRTETDTAAPSEPAPAETAAPAAGTTATADAGGTAPAPSATAAAPDLQDKAIACMNKCQSSLSGCMSKPVALDGGIPDMSAMSECKKAFDECRTACTP